MPRIPADQYVTKVRKPEDIDRFWNDILAETARIPLEPEVVYDPLRSTARIDVYEVFFASLDHVRIAGWYAVPRQRQGSLPGLIQVPGYNMEPPVPKNWAARGYAAFSVAPRGKLRSNRQFNPGYPGLLTYGMVDRNTYSWISCWAGARWTAIASASPDTARAAASPCPRPRCAPKSGRQPPARRTFAATWTPSS